MRREPRQPFAIAADAEAAIACEIARAIVDRQPRQFDGQARVGSVDGPKQRDAAPGVAGGDGFRNAAFGIESEHLRDLAPQPAEAGRRAHADHAGEVVGAEREAAFCIHPPHEAQGMATHPRNGIARRGIRRMRCIEGGMCRRLDNLRREDGCFVRRRRYGLRFRPAFQGGRIGGMWREQCEESDVAAAADPLQRHVQLSCRRLGVAVA